MGKRIRYNIGDVFLIDLENGLKGAGRVLKKDQATVFVELFNINPISENVEFDFTNAIKEKPISSTWCYDDGLKSGEWKIIENRPLEKEIEMPYFWTQDAGNRKYYLLKGSTDNYSGEFTGIEINEDDIHKYEAYGIGDIVCVKNTYIHKLRQLNKI